MTHPAILEPEAAEALDIAQGLPRISAYCYTTGNERTWLSDLATRHQWELLRRLRDLYPYRSWDGPGMAVDGAAIIVHLDALLAGAPK